MRPLTKTLQWLLPTAALILLLASCEEQPSVVTQPAAGDNAVSSSGTIRLDGEIISIPSPVEVVTLIQKNKIPFSESLTNPVASKTRYVSESKKALNLGIYGADLAYISNYDQGQSSNDYFDAVVGLSSDLGILEKIDKSLISKITNSLSERDSLLKLTSRYFQAGDAFLKSNQQNHISSYILIGGWIESLHLAANSARGNEALKTRLGEQKYAATSILKLNSRLDDKAYEPIRGALDALCESLMKLESSYTYQQPINDQKNKTTYFRSQTSVKISDDQLATIADQIAKVRNLITE